MGIELFQKKILICLGDCCGDHCIVFCHSAVVTGVVIVLNVAVVGKIFAGFVVVEEVHRVAVVADEQVVADMSPVGLAVVVAVEVEVHTLLLVDGNTADIVGSIVVAAADSSHLVVDYCHPANNFGKDVGQP